MIIVLLFFFCLQSDHIIINNDKSLPKPGQWITYPVFSNNNNNNNKNKLLSLDLDNIYSFSIGIIGSKSINYCIDGLVVSLPNNNENNNRMYDLTHGVEGGIVLGEKCEYSFHFLGYSNSLIYCNEGFYTIYNSENNIGISNKMVELSLGLCSISNNNYISR